MKDFFLRFLLPVWALIVMVTYFVLHRFYYLPINPVLENSTLEVVAYFLVNALLVLGLAGIFYWLFKSNKISIWQVLGAFLVVTVCLLGVRFAWDQYGMYEGPSLVENNGEIRVFDELLEGDTLVLQHKDVVMNPEAKHTEIWDAVGDYFTMLKFGDGMLASMGNLLLQLTGLLFFMVSFYGWGAFLLKKVARLKLDSTISYLESLGVGTVVFGLFLFFIAKASFLYAAPVWGFLILGVLGAYLCRPKNFSFGKLSWLQIVIGALFIWLISWNFIETASPFPQDFDDFRLYLNLPNLLAAGHSYIGGYYMHAFTLIQTAPVLLFGSTALAKMLIFGFGVLSSIAVYLLTKKFTKSTNKALLFALLFASIPTIYIHSYLHTKVELPLVFFGMLSLLCFIEYLDTKKTAHLYLMGLFVGFLVSMKVSALFFVVAAVALVAWKLFDFWLGLLVFAIAFAFYFLIDSAFLVTALNDNNVLRIIALVLLAAILGMAIYKNLKKISNLKKSLPVFIIFAGFCLIAVSPWLINNFLSADHSSVSLNHFLADSNNPGPDVDFEELGIDYAQCEKTGGVEADYGRYITERPLWMRLLLLPWDATYHVSVRSIIANIGYLFLGLIPILLVGFNNVTQIKGRRETFVMLFVGGIYFWLIWAVAGGNVIWYGFAGLGFLMLMLFGGVNTMWKEKGWPKVFIISYLIIWLVASFYLRSNTFFSRTHTLLPHIGGLATTDQMATLQWPGILNVAEILNENPEDTIILTNLGRVVYFTDANHERIFVDQFYDLLNCFYNERDEELFVERLKASGFDFIALSPLTNPDEHFPDEYYDVQREIMEAIDNNFDFAFVNKFYLIYEI